MNKRLWTAFAIMVAAVLAILIIWKNDQPNGDIDISGIDIEKLVTVEDIEKDNIPDHYIGNVNSKIIVIGYEDFACVHCAQLSSTFKNIMEDYQDRVLFIYRNFSLNYPNSIVSQSAAEAAYLLGGTESYWKMHELLFQDDSTWTGQAIPTERRRELLSQFAEETNLNVDDFLKAIENYRGNGILTKINRDSEMGKKAGITGTPVWFVNGKQVDELTDSAVRQAIDEALKSTE